MRLIDLTGRRFGRLTVIEKSDTKQRNSVTWICACDCGKITKPIPGCSLRSGNTRSCGCLHVEQLSDRVRKHGHHGTRLYRIWQGMKARCKYVSYSKHKRYAGRGITVCDEWKDDFQAFYDWAMENGYSDELTIDRINNDGNYCPDNCRWVGMDVQNKNKTHGDNPYRDKKTGRYTHKPGVTNNDETNTNT